MLVGSPRVVADGAPPPGRGRPGRRMARRSSRTSAGVATTASSTLSIGVASPGSSCTAGWSSASRASAWRQSSASRLSGRVSARVTAASRSRPPSSRGSTSARISGAAQSGQARRSSASGSGARLACTRACQRPSASAAWPVASSSAPGRLPSPGRRSRASRNSTRWPSPAAVTSSAAKARRRPWPRSIRPAPAVSRARMPGGAPPASISMKAPRLIGASSTESGASCGIAWASSRGESAGRVRPAVTRIGLPTAWPETRTGRFSSPSRSVAAPSSTRPPLASRRISRLGSSSAQVRPSPWSTTVTSPPTRRMRRSAETLLRSLAGCISAASICNAPSAGLPPGLPSPGAVGPAGPAPRVPRSSPTWPSAPRNTSTEGRRSSTVAGTTRPSSSGARARVAAASGSSARTAPPESTTRTPRNRISSGVPEPLRQPSQAMAASRTVSRVPAPSWFTARSSCRANTGTGSGPWSSRQASQAPPSASATARAMTPRASHCAATRIQPSA